MAVERSRGHGVERGGVDGAGAEEDEEDGSRAGAGSVVSFGPKKQSRAGGTARSALNAGNVVEGLGGAFGPALGEDAADDGSAEAGRRR